MKIIYSDIHKKHNPQFEIYDGVKEPYAEKVARVEMIIQTLREKNIGKIIAPQSFSMRYILAIHHQEYITFIKNRSEKLGNNEMLYPSYFINDTYAPITAGTYEAAKISSDIALTGARFIQKGESIIYSLCRPPGHHAEEKAMGGYCYFNNAAIAANYLSQFGTVAILDIDFHHGNGTQQAFYERCDVYYVSLHADPRVKYPYATGFSNEEGKREGEGFNKNFPLPLGISDADYLTVLQKALRLIRAFHPTFLIVSAGFDTYEKDPICGFGLTIPFYETMGKEINTLHVPTLIIQEGGYFVEDLGNIAVSFLRGINPSAF